MADLQNLELLDEGPEVAAEMPEERAARLPMLQPSLAITFQLPPTFDFEPMQTEQGQRIYAKFKDASVVKVYPHGTPVRGTISNLEQNRKGEDGKEVKVNPFAYLLRNALGFTGPLRNNKDYATALAAYPGHYFIADWVWGARCSAKRDIYRDGEGVIKGRSGCGQQYAVRSRTYKDKTGAMKTVLRLPREADGAYIESFKCQGKRADGTACDATIFANGEWSNFKPVPVEENSGTE